MFSLVFSIRNLREQEGKGRKVVSICYVRVGGKGEEDPELSGVFSLVFLIRNLKEKGGGGSGAFRSVFLIVFNKEP